MSANQHEYYIRQPSDTEARGPFTFAQLTALSDSGGIDARTLYFDAANEQWIPLAGSDELGVLFSRKPASAAGSPELAGYRTKLLRALLFCSGLVLLARACASVPQGGFPAAFASPVAWFGALDLLLAVLTLFLFAGLPRLVRVRAATGLGFFATLLWLQTNIAALAIAVLWAACLWLATTLGTRRALLGNTIAGLALLAAFIYCLP